MLTSSRQARAGRNRIAVVAVVLSVSDSATKHNDSYGDLNILRRHTGIHSILLGWL